MNLRPTTPMWPHWSCEVHLSFRGKCTSTTSAKKIKKDNVKGFFVDQSAYSHQVIFLKTALKFPKTATLTERLGGDSVPCWWRLYRWSSASGTADWCCDWLETNRKISHWLEIVWTPQWTETFCVDSAAHLKTGDLGSANRFSLGLQVNKGSLKQQFPTFFGPRTGLRSGNIVRVWPLTWDNKRTWYDRDENHAIF